MNEKQQNLEKIDEEMNLDEYLKEEELLKTKPKKNKKQSKQSKKTKNDETSLKSNLEQEKNKDDFILKKIEERKEELLNTSKKQEFDNELINKDKYHIIHDNLFLKSQLNSIPVYLHKVDGLLFLGDPHYWSKRPGRRVDDFSQTVLNKLSETIEYANKHNLLIICLGDLFEKPEDNDISALTKLIKVLKKAKHFISAVGNHDLNEYKLMDHNPLKMLSETNIIELMEDNGFAYQIEFTNSDHKVLLGSTPYGMMIPDNVLPLLIEENENKIYKPLTETQLKNIEDQEKGNKVAGNLPIYLKQNKINENTRKIISKFKEENKIQDVIWITHHDLAMNGAYPNSIPLKEIVGVDFVINGHIHGTKVPVKVDHTVYYNTGNITRMKIDMIDHKPAVWEYQINNEDTIPSINGLPVKKLLPYYLTIQEGKDVFKLIGKHAGKETLTNEEIEEIKNGLDLNEEDEKIFASLLLKQEKSTEKTDDGTLVQESLINFIEENEISEDLKNLLFNLCERSINLN